jgi:hypothetical protein
MGLFGFLDKLLAKLPIQDRIERIRNELDNLKKEKEKIEKYPLDINKPEDRKKADRLSFLYERIDYLSQLLRNKGS